MRTILIKSISKEIWAIFFTSLFVIIFITMATRMMGMITDLIVNYHVKIGNILNIVLCLLPKVVLFSMPAACLMSVLLAFIRMSGDNEIIALNSSGVSLYQILPPVILFSFISYILACFLAFYFVPLGNRSLKTVFFELISSKADYAIKERIFHEPFNNIILYVNSYSKKQGIMKDIFLVDKREQTIKTIIAEQGRIITDQKSGTLTIQLTKCDIFTEKGTDKGYGSFLHYNYPVDLKEIKSSIISRGMEPDDMYFTELLSELKNSSETSEKNNLMKLTFYEMFSLPLSVFFIGIIGAPLGAHVRAHGRTKGIVISLFIFLAYYICVTGIRYLCERDIIKPFLGVWIPVIFLVIIGLYLLVRSAQNRPFGLFERIIPANQ